MTERNGITSADDLHLATLGRLTRGALHELANPLLALVGTAEFAIEDAEPGSKLRSRLELVHGTGLEIAGIVRALQGYVRERDEPARLLSLGEAAEEIAALVRLVSAVRDVELEVRREAEADVVAAPGVLKPQLVQLVLDALAGAERGDVVTLEVSAQGEEAVARVGAAELRLPIAGRGA